jgi:hypothetical protein
MVDLGTGATPRVLDLTPPAEGSSETPPADVAVDELMSPREELNGGNDVETATAQPDVLSIIRCLHVRN